MNSHCKSRVKLTVVWAPLRDLQLGYERQYVDSDAHQLYVKPGFF